MINNFKKIRGLLKFDKPNDYYLVEVVKRRRDNPRLPVESMLIKEILIYSLKDFDDNRDEILCACEVVRARAYIWLNVRNAEITGFHCMKRLSCLLMEKNFIAISGLFRKVSEEIHFDSEPKYLIDIGDDCDLDKIELTVRSSWPEETRDTNLLELIKTSNGFHVIANAFDTKKFREAFPQVQVFTDKPTVLYAPISSALAAVSEKRTC